MHLTNEALENFRRAIQFDAMLGVLNIASGEIHLALVEPRDGAPPITEDRYSYIGGKKLPPLSGAGGHPGLAGGVGISGWGNGPVAVGFSIIKLGVNLYKIGTLCSSLNYKFIDDERVPPPPQSKEANVRMAPRVYYEQIVDCLDATITLIT